MLSLVHGTDSAIGSIPIESMMHTLIQDCRYGLRTLTGSPGFTFVAVVTLALGIGANSTIFSWITSTLLDPVPGIRHTSDLVVFVRGERSDNPTPPCSYPDYTDLRDQNRSFSGLLAFHDDWMSITGEGKPLRIYGAMASANYFDVLGVSPVLGRGFLAEEELKPGGAPVVVISHGLWQSRFAGDRSVLGKIVEINRHPYTIVGVTPPAFQGCKTGLRTEVWVPLMMADAVTGGNQLIARDNFWFNVYGRLRPGTPAGQAQEEMNVLMQRIVEQYPDSHQDSSRMILSPLWRSPIGANSLLHTLLPTLLAIAGIVLLLACANVANLLLVRSVARRREIAIRLALGASRWRLVRQFLVESLLLGLAGGGAALLLTTWTASTFAYFIPPVSVPVSFNIQVDRTVLLATLVVSILTAMIFGILPALRSSGLCPAAVMKEEAGSVSGGLHRSRLASTLVVAQVSLSLLLLVCAGLFARSFQNAQRCNPGFNPERVLLASFNLLSTGCSKAGGVEFDRQLLAKVQALPGVESATLADSVPLCFANHTSITAPEGYVPQPHEAMEIGRAYVGPHYLRTMRIPLVAGRDLTAHDDRDSQPVAVINQALAERYWPGQNALGKRIRAQDTWFTVVGVAQNIKWASLQAPAQPFLYLPLFQNYYPEVTLHVRVSGDPQAIMPAVTRTVEGLHPDLPMFDVTTLKVKVRVASFPGRIAGTMVGAFGLLALMLAAVGIYGVVSYATGQRTHEIGIRMALGAQRSEVSLQVLSHGLRLTLVGLGVGFALTMAATRLLRTQLFGVTSTDPLTFASAAALLCLVALVACYLPARQAIRVDPMVALRHE